MKIQAVFKFLGFFTALITACMMCPFIYSAIYTDADTIPFAIGEVFGIAVSALLYLLGRGADLADMRGREAMASVTFGWIIASAIGGMPFYLHGAAPTFADAFFEAMSGFTTTGATILASIDTVPRGLLLWRDVTHWLGGMGIIVLTLVVMPIAGGGGFSLFAAEAPGLDDEKMTPRIQNTAVILWLIYIGLTVLLAVMLMIFGMDMYDAVTHSMGTISTGGFSPHDGSLAFFDDPIYDWTITIFMFASGANFTLHYLALRGRSLKAFTRDPEFKLYTFISVVISLCIAAALYADGSYSTFADCLRHGTFQTLSFITTTGYLSSNYDGWPHFAKALLFLTFFMGACAGSTAGGFKQIRLLILFRHAKRQVRMLLAPRAIIPIRIGEKTMRARGISSTFAFLGLYAAVFFTGTFLVSFFEPDFITAMSGTATTLGNVGPAFGALGASYCFSDQIVGAKWIYSFLMLCGRLELFTVLMLFTKTFWENGIVFNGKRRGSS